MIVAIIPARGGSKRVPRKNIREFHGRPMIAWPIDAAKRSGCFDRIIVSTDDPEISTVAVGLGAEVPFVRPPQLSDDHAGTTAVIAHACEWLLGSGLELEAVCCLYATAASIDPASISRGLEILRANDSDFAFSVCRYSHPIERALRVSQGGEVSMVDARHEATRTQDLPPTYYDAGQFYWGKARAWLERRSILSGQSSCVIIDDERVVDIDTEEDWTAAERRFEGRG